MTQPKLTVINGARRPPTRLDWATVEQSLAANGNEEEPRTLKFQRLVLNKLFGISTQEADDFITDGGDDCGIDCFVIDYNNNKIHLVSTKTVEAYDKAKKNFPGSEVAKLICFVRDLVGRNEGLLTRSNPLLRAKVVECWEAIAGGRVFQVCVHACSNQSELIERESFSLHEGLADFRAIVVEHHLTRFSEEISKSWSPPTYKALRFIGKDCSSTSRDQATTACGRCSVTFAHPTCVPFLRTIAPSSSMRIYSMQMFEEIWESRTL